MFARLLIKSASGRTVTNVSDTEQTPDGWTLPQREQGIDAFWDRLGEKWQAVDGVVESTRIYVLWDWSNGRSQIAGLCVMGGPIRANTLRSIPIGRLENLPAAIAETMPRDRFLAELSPLMRGKDEAPEEFADRVAYYYRVFTGMSSKPAKAIADHSGVPVTTVRGWVREARLRGKLPPGTRGKAG